MVEILVPIFYQFWTNAAPFCESTNGPIQSTNGPIQSTNGPIQSTNGPIQIHYWPLFKPIYGQYWNIGLIYACWLHGWGNLPHIFLCLFISGWDNLPSLFLCHLVSGWGILPSLFQCHLVSGWGNLPSLFLCHLATCPVCFSVFLKLWSCH